jgi:hypothetical protein
MKQTSDDLLKPIVDRLISEDYYDSDIYIKMAHVVTNRAYWAFSIMTIVCLMTGVVIFNHYWSYEENMYRKMNIFLRLDNPTKDASADKTMMRFGKIAQDSLIKELRAERILPIDSLCEIKGENPISKRIRENYIDNHIESAYISIPFVGIKVSVNDILLVMSFTFFILAMWLFLCIRAENLTIGKILSLSQPKGINIRRRIFYGICFNNMFFPTTQRKKVYSELSKTAKSVREELNDIPIKTKRHKWRNDVVCFIFFVPFVIMSINLLTHFDDITNITGKNKEYTTIEYKNQKYYINDAKTAGIDFKNVNIESVNDPYNKYLWWIFGFSTCFVIALFYPCFRTYRCQKGTSRVLYHFKQRFKHDDDCVKSITRHQLKESEADIQVVAMDSKAIFSDRHKYDTYKDVVAQRYNEENGFYLLTHSGDIKEVIRLKEYLAEKYNYRNSSEDISLEDATDKEYFIFLKKNIVKQS